MSRRRLIGTAAILAVLGAGCGGEDRLSQEEFTQQAAEICTDANRRLDEVEVSADTEQAVARYADEALPILRERQDRLDDLRPPEEGQEAFDAFLEQSEAQIDALERVREAAASGNRDAARAASRDGAEATIKGAGVALQLDIRECVRRPR